MCPSSSTDTASASPTLPQGDHTPADFAVPHPTSFESYIKRPLRRFAYPVLTSVADRYMRRRYDRDVPFRVDQWLWGQRGNDYAANRRRINAFRPISGKDILIAGCGTGHDVPSWLPYKPRSLAGVDFFAYERAWRMIESQFGRGSETKLSFAQANLTDLGSFADQSFDLVGSDAVFEHVSDLPAVVREFYRVLRPGGIMYATYGALWYCWGGDHVSGYDGLAGGYNHLLLGKDEYQGYLDKLGPYDHRPEDGRTWAMHGLFSYLRPADYMRIFREHKLEVRFTAALIEPRAAQFLKAFPEKVERLKSMASQMDLMIAGMTVIAEKV